MAHEADEVDATWSNDPLQYAWKGTLKEANSTFTVLAHDKGRSKDVILKIKTIPEDDFDMENFLLSAKIHSRLKSTFLLTPKYTFVNKQELWLVFERISGGPLSDILFSHYRTGIPDESIVARIMLDVVTGVKVMHDNEVTHRNIRASSLHYSKDKGKTMLSEFGDLKALSYSTSTNSSRAIWNKRDAFHDIEGLEQLEQIANVKPNTEKEKKDKKKYEKQQYFAIDVYALGVTALQLAFGEPPRNHKPSKQQDDKSKSDDKSKFPSVNSYGNDRKNPFSKDFGNFVKKCCCQLQKRSKIGELVNHSWFKKASNHETVAEKLAAIVKSTEERIHDKYSAPSSMSTQTETPLQRQSSENAFTFSTTIRSISKTPSGAKSSNDTIVEETESDLKQNDNQNNVTNGNVNGTHSQNGTVNNSNLTSNSNINNIGYSEKQANVNGTHRNGNGNVNGNNLNANVLTQSETSQTPLAQSTLAMTNTGSNQSIEETPIPTDYIPPPNSPPTSIRDKGSLSNSTYHSRNISDSMSDAKHKRIHSNQSNQSFQSMSDSVQNGTNNQNNMNIINNNQQSLQKQQQPQLLPNQSEISEYQPEVKGRFQVKEFSARISQSESRRAPESPSPNAEDSVSKSYQSETEDETHPQTTHGRFFVKEVTEDESKQGNVNHPIQPQHQHGQHGQHGQHQQQSQQQQQGIREINIEQYDDPPQRPKDVNTWTKLHAQQWVASLGKNYQQYAQTFADNGVDGEMLNELDNEILENELQIQSKLHRKNILAKRDKLFPKRKSTKI